MSYDVRLSLQAKKDIQEIFEYIAVILQAPDTALNQLDRIEKAINSLENMPERNHLYDREPWKSRNLRMMTVDNYIVFYIPEMDKNIVTVIRVIYGGRDIEKQFK